MLSMKICSNLYYKFFLKILISLLKDLIKEDGFTLIDHNGNKYTIGKPDNENKIQLIIHNKTLYRKLIFSPGLFFGEAYMQKQVSLNNGNLSNFLEIVLKNVEGRQGIFKEASINKLIFKIKTFLKKNNLVNSKLNVAHHYDISDDLYRLFLDNNMQYSCGFFKNEKDSLETAQKNKINYIIRKLNINDSMKVLDIGSGWGSLSLEIARQTGAEVMGITLSENQLLYSKKILSNSNLDHLVKFKLLDYRNVVGTFDRIVSVGMFEHVGLNFYKDYFNSISKLLKKDGFALLHTIGSLNPPGPVEPWITKYIFPGGYVPTVSEIAPIIENSNLMLSDLEIWREHYAKTLSLWKDNFFKNKESIEKMFDEEFVRMWEYYLASCQYSFIYSKNVVFQALLSKKLDSVPVTRDYIYD